MATTTQSETGDVYRIYNDGTRQLQTAKPVLSSRTVTKPDPVSRPKPKDLFANATPRRVSSSNYQGTIGVLNSGSFKVEAPASYWFGTPSILKLAPATINDFADLDNEVRALIKAQNVNLAQSLGEYKQTSRMFANAAKDIYQTFHSLRSGRAMADFVRTLQHPDTRNGRKLANRWLEYQYGLRPLMNDVHGAAEALQKQISNGMTRRVSRQRREQSSSSMNANPFITSGSETRTRRVSARFTVSGAGLKTLSEVGITNPAALAWELVPYSFVVDWFVPVGDFLNGLDALTGVTGLLVQRSASYESEISQTMYGEAVIVPPVGFQKTRITERFGVSGSLSFGKLAYKPSLSATKVANALALLRQLKR